MSTTAPAAAPFGTYLAEINRTPLLTADEEKELGGRALAGDGEARELLVRANLRLVVNIARGYAGRGLPIEDLVSEGTMGLLRAVEGFDPTMNTRFSTYAAFWIKQGIKRGIVTTAKTIRIPAHMALSLSKWRRALGELTDALRRLPTGEEVAGRLGLSKKKMKLVTDALDVSRGPQSDHGADGTGITASLADARARPPGAAMGEADQLERMLQLLDKMDRRDATVLRMRFGLGGEEPKTLKEIGDHLGLTRERIRQIEDEALAKLADGIDAV